MENSNKPSSELDYIVDEQMKKSLNGAYQETPVQPEKKKSMSAGKKAAVYLIGAAIFGLISAATGGSLGGVVTALLAGLIIFVCRQLTKSSD